MQMFMQDVEAQIMPYSGRSSKLKVGVRLEGSGGDAGVLADVCAGLDEDYGSRHGSTLEVVSGAVRAVARDLMWDGSVAYRAGRWRCAGRRRAGRRLRPAHPSNQRRSTGETTRSGARSEDAEDAGRRGDITQVRDTAVANGMAGVNASRTWGKNGLCESYGDDFVGTQGSCLNGLHSH